MSDQSPERYSERLLLTSDHEVWLIHWEEGHDTGFHDHDRSGGHVMVVSGAVREDRLVVGGPPSTRDVHAGESFSFEPQDIHRVTHVEGAPAVTIHVYSPPLQRTGAYIVESDGTLRRESLPSDEELRPLAAMT